MGKTVKCNSRSSDSITKACYVITIVSLFQINNFIICDSIFEERQKYTGSVYSHITNTSSYILGGPTVRIIIPAATTIGTRMHPIAI